MGNKKRADYGGSVYDQQYFSDDELRQAAEIREAAKAGRTSWDDAHNFVENIRKKYGYSGGGDGFAYTPSGASGGSGGAKTSFNSTASTTTKGTSSPGKFTYEDAPQYTNKYKDQIDRLTDQILNREAFQYGDAPQYANKYKDRIDSLTDQILNREAFSYDPEKDPTYQQYRDTYTREGKKAMEDTLGQVSARTGGMASSYAGTVAQQSYNDYMTKLSDKVPELRQLAYSMYQDEGNRQRQNLEMLTALEQGDFEKYAALLAQYNTDRSFAYNRYQDENNQRLQDLSAIRGLEQDDYSKYADRLGQYNTDRSFDYNAYRDNISDLRYGDEMALQKAETMAAAGDFSGYKALGYTDAEIAKLKAAYDASQALTGYSGGGYSGGGSGSSGGSSRSSRSSGSSGGYSGSGKTTGSGTGDIYTKMNNAGIQSEHIARAYLLSAGYNQTDASRIAAYYATDWMRNKKSGSGDPLTSSTKTQTPAFASRSAAVNYLKNKGASDSEINGLLTEEDWKKKRATYATTGYGDEAVKAYSSYRDYLNAFTQYAMERYGT